MADAVVKERRISRVEFRLDQVEYRLDKIEYRLDKIEGELGHIRTAVLETGRAVKGHEDRIVALEGRN